VQVSVARYLRTPPHAARREDLVSATRTAYAARAIAGARLLLATVQIGPITVVPHRDKAIPLYTFVDPVSAPSAPNRVVGGAAGYRPRVRSAYYERVYVHSPEGQTLYRPGIPSAQGPGGPLPTCPISGPAPILPPKCGGLARTQSVLQARRRHYL